MASCGSHLAWYSASQRTGGTYSCQADPVGRSLASVMVRPLRRHASQYTSTFRRLERHILTWQRDRHGRECKTLALSRHALECLQIDPNGRSRLRVQPSLPAPRSRAEQAKRPPLRAPFKHCLEIRARPLRFEPGGLGCFAHTEIAVDPASALMALGTPAA